MRGHLPRILFTAKAFTITPTGISTTEISRMVSEMEREFILTPTVTSTLACFFKELLLATEYLNLQTETNMSATFKMITLPEEPTRMSVVTHTRESSMELPLTE